MRLVHDRTFDVDMLLLIKAHVEIIVVLLRDCCYFPCYVIIRQLWCVRGLSF